MVGRPTSFTLHLSAPRHGGWESRLPLPQRGGGSSGLVPGQPSGGWAANPPRHYPDSFTQKFFGPGLSACPRALFQDGHAKVAQHRTRKYLLSLGEAWGTFRQASAFARLRADCPTYEGEFLRAPGGVPRLAAYLCSQALVHELPTGLFPSALQQASRWLLRAHAYPRRLEWLKQPPLPPPQFRPPSTDINCSQP